MNKSLLRKEVIARRDLLPSRERFSKSMLIAARLRDMDHYNNSLHIMFYVNFGSEVETGQMISAALSGGKQAMVPKSIPEKRTLIPSLVKDYPSDLAPGAYGIMEPRVDTLRPVDPKDIDLLIVPGVAFDTSGNRLGYGGGYYDRFFPRLRPGVKLVALAFELQLLKEVPVEDWDRRVDLVVTEERVITI